MFTKKYLRRLIIPLIFEQILAVTVGMADIVMVTSAGEAAVAGVSLVDTVNVLIIGLFSALATGGAVVSAQYIGQKKQKEACQAANQLVLVTVSLSMCIMLLATIGCSGILRLIYGDVSATIFANAKTYFFISALSYPFIALYNACAALFRSMGNSRITLITSLIMNALNVLGNAILIYGFHKGVWGAAVATLIARIAAALIMTVLIRNEKLQIHIDKKLRLGYHKVMIKRILGIGIPNGLENSIFQVGKILVARIILLSGETAVAANAIANTMAGIEVLPGSAMGLALITIIGQCVGARDYEGAKTYTKRLMKFTYIFMAILNLSILLLINPVMGIFGRLSQETADLAKQLIIYHSITCVLAWPASFTLPNALRAASDVRYPMTISIISMWVWRIGFSFILGPVAGLGVFGVWIAMSIDWVFRAVCFIHRFSKDKWMHRHVS